jgi:hypothetical protein
MTKIIQTRVEANGDVHLEFSGFAGRDCQAEEDRLRRELASLGLNVGVNLFPKLPGSQAESGQQLASSFGRNTA